MKRFHIFSLVGVVALSVLAVAVAHSPRKAADGRDKEESPAGEAEMINQDAGTADRRLVKATTGFGFKLYATLASQGADKSIFISPASVAMALAMTYNGAEAETKQAMGQALGFDSLSLDELNRGFSQLRAALASPDARVRLEIANSLWAKKSVRFKPDFVQRDQKFFGAEVTSLDFGDPASVTRINSWVSSKTNGKIDKILDQIDPMAVLYLINAIYFKGSWTNEFDKAKTKEDPFTLGTGSQTQVQMMHQSGDYRYLEADGFQAVRLGYGKGDVGMYVFLPTERSNLAEFQKSLTYDNWERWMTTFGKRPGDIGLPRFKLEYDVTLNDALKSLGMGVAFDAARANFRGMADTTDNISISRVKHKSFVEVNEEGTEAAAATSVGMVTTSMPVQRKRFQMIVNRPFFFSIRNDTTGTVLFMGSIVDPR